MQGIDPRIYEYQRNNSNEVFINEEMHYEVKSVALKSDHHEEESIKTFVEGIFLPVNPPIIDPHGPLLVEIPSSTFLDAYSSYNLPSYSSIRRSFGMNPSYFCFPKGLGNLSLSTTPVVDTASASSLLRTTMTQVTLTQPFVSTYPFTHGSGNIHSSLFPHMHTLSDLLGRPIGQMADSQVVQKTMVTQANQPPSQPS